MTDSTITNHMPQEQQTPAKPKQPRQMVRFTFYKLDPQWQLLPFEQRQQGKQELTRIVAEHGEQALIRTFSLYGLRPCSHFMIWQPSFNIFHLHALHSKIRRSPTGPSLRDVHPFLSTPTPT